MDGEWEGRCRRMRRVLTQFGAGSLNRGLKGQSFIRDDAGMSPVPDKDMMQDDDNGKNIRNCETGKQRLHGSRQTAQHGTYR